MASSTGPIWAASLHCPAAARIDKAALLVDTQVDFAGDATARTPQSLVGYIFLSAAGAFSVADLV